MVRTKLLVLWGLLGCSAGVLVSLNGCGGGSRGGSSGSSTTTPPQKIQHVVVIFQENRNPDNLFQDPKLIAAGADIKNVGLDSQGDQITLTPAPLEGSARVLRRTRTLAFLEAQVATESGQIAVTASSTWAVMKG